MHYYNGRWFCHEHCLLVAAVVVGLLSVLILNSGSSSFMGQLAQHSTELGIPEIEKCQLNQ